MHPELKADSNSLYALLGDMGTGIKGAVDRCPRCIDSYCSDGVFRYLETEFLCCLHCLTGCTCHGIMLRFHLRRTNRASDY